MTPNKNLLNGLQVLDFTHRLPGPLAGHVLALTGAKVIKVEDEVFQDAFIKGLFAEMNSTFFVLQSSLKYTISHE